MSVACAWRFLSDFQALFSGEQNRNQNIGADV
jgi:hypothetical protein